MGITEAPSMPAGPESFNFKALTVHRLIYQYTNGAGRASGTMNRDDKSFLPAASCDLAPPPNGPINLGSLLGHPEKPKRCLNADTRLEPSKFFSHQHRDVQITNVEIQNRSAGIFSSFLAEVLGIGLDIGAKSSSQAAWHVGCKSIDTTWFQPTQKFIFDSLQDEEVQAWGKELLWQRSLYMITGIKVARGVRMETVDVKTRDATVQLKLDGSGQAVPASVAPHVSTESKSGLALKWKESDDFVL